VSAWRRSGSSASDWIPEPEQPERPRGADAGRSPEATARRRARKEERREEFVPPMGRIRPSPPAEPTSPPDFSVRTVDGCSWDFEGRYCRWNLPTHSGRPALGPDADFQRMLTAQRDRIMQRGGEGSN
jgi:hypothetical protein